MSKKFRFLTSDSIKKKISSKSFKIINLVLCIIIICAINLDSIIKLFGGDFDEPVNIYVVDEAGIYDEFKDTIDNSYLDVLNNYHAEVKLADKDIEELKKEIKEEETKDIIIRVSEKEHITLKEMYNVEIISYEKINSLLYQDMVLAINKVKEKRALKMAGIDQLTLDEVQAGVEVDRILLSEDAKDEELMEMVGAILMIAFIVPFFMLIMLIVQVIGAEINEEKTSRGMEIIISSVSPEAHFMSKLIAANVFAILQGALLILYSFIGAMIRMFTSAGLTDVVNNTINSNPESVGQVNEYIQMFIESDVMGRLISGIPYFLLLILLSFFAYSLFIGVLASVTTSMEDYNQIQTPVMVFLMLGYFLAIYGSLFEGSIFIKIMSYIPFISGILAPVMYIMGEISIYGLMFAISLLAFTCYLLYKYGLRVYKVGILNYSSSKLWTKIFNALKKK